MPLLGVSHWVADWEWPEMLRALITQHGAIKVYRTGIEALGFPPTWISLGSEIRTLKMALG